MLSSLLKASVVDHVSQSVEVLAIQRFISCSIEHCMAADVGKGCNNLLTHCLQPLTGWALGFPQLFSNQKFDLPAPVTGVKPLAYSRGSQTVERIPLRVLGQ